MKYDIPKKFGFEKNGWCYNWTKTVSESDFRIEKRTRFRKISERALAYEVYLKKYFRFLQIFLSIEFAGKIIVFWS